MCRKTENFVQPKHVRTDVLHTLQSINIYESDYEVLILSMCNSLPVHLIYFCSCKFPYGCAKYKLIHACMYYVRAQQ